MGIKNKIPIKNNLNGFYNKYNFDYNIVIDGENIRYKALNKYNLMNTQDTEKQLVDTIMKYLYRLIYTIIKPKMNDQKPKNIYIYMDTGKRAKNKEIRRTTIDTVLNANYRNLFMKSCNNTFEYKLIDNIIGEAELLMYLTRDKTIPLNIFVTGDTDIITICYGHKAILNNINENNVNSCDIINDNFYKNNSNNLVDSAVWFDCSSKQFFGLDSLQQNFRYSKNTFLTILAFAGCDYIQPLVTESMLSYLLNFSDETIKIIESLKTPIEILISIIYFCCTEKINIIDCNSNNNELGNKNKEKTLRCTFKKLKFEKNLINIENFKTFYDAINNTVNNYKYYIQTNLNDESVLHNMIDINQYSILLYYMCFNSKIFKPTFSSIRNIILNNKKTLNEIIERVNSIKDSDNNKHQENYVSTNDDDDNNINNNNVLVYDLDKEDSFNTKKKLDLSVYEYNPNKRQKIN